VNGRRLRVAVLGAGTVGREVVRAFLDSPERLRPADGAALELAGVAVRDVAGAAAAGIPAGLLTDAPAHLVAAPDVDVVVELMGGLEPARTLVLAALGAGRPVVTANKHLLARYGPDLEAAARAGGGALRFEASVGGGIPILAPLAADLASNEISRVRGIVNGTTNYILSEMADEGRAYGEVLAAAQAAGYAEADPTADVEGLDSVDKLVVLARLAFGTWLDPGDVPNRNDDGAPGITGVTAADLAAANEAGFSIKLVAEARRPATGARDTIQASVSCVAASQWSELAWIDGVTNHIEVDAEPLGRVGFTGPGAGGPATASAVLGDLLAIARGGASTWAGLREAGRGHVAQLPSRPTFDGPSGARYPVVD
jgi:homoserine dehydrogenase